MHDSTSPRMEDFLAVAAARETCIPAFDIGHGHPEFVNAVFAACRDLDALALFLCWSGFGGEGGFGPIVALTRAMSAETGVPAVLHLDHSKDEEKVKAAIDAGFASVMFDGDEFEFEENVRRTRAVVQYARERGVVVEGETGSLAREHSGSGRQELTDPDKAAEFVERTGVDLLTPSVGNRHGCVGFTVPLDWELIETLSARIPVPMALHGGSGVALEDARRTGRHGFRKLNLATRLFDAYGQAVRDHIHRNPDSGWMRWTRAARSAIEGIVREYLLALDMQGTSSDLRST